MKTEALQIIAGHASEGARLRETFFHNAAESLRQAAFHVARSIAGGGKILFCGNGGSAADAQHLAGEFVNRFLIDRPPLPALALTTDTSVLTAIGNDFSFDQIFSRQVRALGREGDVLIAISTSGNSPDVLEALHAAGEQHIFRIGLTGGDGGALALVCDLLLKVPHTSTPLIQEVHIAAGHLICRLADYYLFENAALLAANVPAED